MCRKKTDLDWNRCAIPQRIRSYVSGRRIFVSAASAFHTVVKSAFISVITVLWITDELAADGIAVHPDAGGRSFRARDVHVLASHRGHVKIDRARISVRAVVRNVVTHAGDVIAVIMSMDVAIVAVCRRARNRLSRNAVPEIGRVAESVSGKAPRAVRSARRVSEGACLFFVRTSSGGIARVRGTQISVVAVFVKVHALSRAVTVTARIDRARVIIGTNADYHGRRPARGKSFVSDRGIPDQRSNSGRKRRRPDVMCGIFERVNLCPEFPARKRSRDRIYPVRDPSAR